MPRRAPSTLAVARPLAGPGVPGGFAADPSRWLPDGREPRGRGRWRMPLSLRGVHRGVFFELGAPWRDGDDVWRSVAWRPQEERGDWLPGPLWLPAFAGSLGVRRAGKAGVELVLEGAYVPPFGRLGRAMDRLLLGRLARRSARELLDAISEKLAPADAQNPRAASFALRSAK